MNNLIYQKIFITNENYIADSSSYGLHHKQEWNNSKKISFVQIQWEAIR